MPGYADVEDPVALLNRAPDTSGGPTVEDAVREAGFEVQAVDWVWRKVVGESLVDSIIKPITGDFEKISKQAGEWKNVKDALQAIRNNLNAGLDELGPAWSGEAADKFRNLIGTTWTLGIEADAQAANLIGFALGKVAEGSKRACDQALKLIKMLVDKLIEAAAMLPIPVVGWGRAVKLVYDGIQIYNAIMQLIEGIKAIIQGAQQVIQGIQQVGTAISKIKDIHNLNDALNVANEAGEGVANIHSGASNIKDGATQAAGAAGDLASHGRSAADNATGLRDERAAARDHGTDPSGTPGGPGNRRPGEGTQQQGDGTNRPDNPHDTRTPEDSRDTCGDPVDVVTGEVILGQTDVRLAGVLPLVLRRTHISSYRAGRLYGRSWASTLDQRLELDAKGIVFVADDGMLLVYPEPSRGEDVLPEVGPRWPLCRTETGYAITRPEAGQTLHFAGQGTERPLTAIVDRNENRFDLHRDPAGTITHVQHSGGYRVDVDTRSGHVTELRLRQTTGAPLALVRYRYTESGDLSEVINSSNLPLRFEYDRDGRITQWIDRNGQWYRYLYDEHGRCVANQGSEGFLNGTFTYDRESRTTRYTDALGNSTIFLIDTRNNIVAETDALGRTTTSEWDDADQLLSRTDPLGRVTRYTYDAAGNVVVLTRPDGHEVRASYNDLGLVTTLALSDGTEWRRDYDERGNLTVLTDPTGVATRYSYDPRGNLTRVEDALGNVRHVEADAAGLAIAATDPLGATTRYDRDVFGRVAAITDPLGGTVRLNWTIEGTLLSRTQPDGATERWRYDGEGNVIEHVDAFGGVTRTEYGGFDLPTARTAPDGTRMEFGYDRNLNLVSVTNPQGLVWRYDYDACGNLVRETDFNGRTLEYSLDAAGQLASQTNGAGNTVSFVRDSLGYVVEKRAGESVTTFAYDPAGRLLSAASVGIELSYTRDAIGRVTAETRGGRTVVSEFDVLGRRTRRRTPSGVESTWRYNANNQPVALTTGDQTVEFSYDPAGRETRRQIGAGATLAQQWDANHRLTTQTLTSARRARLVQQRAYRYRADGQVLGIDDHVNGSRRFELDRIGRVTAVQAQTWTERYAYDSAGNIAMASWPALPDGTGEPESQGPREYAGTVIRRAGNTHYQHDPQGRVVARQVRTLSGQRRVWTYTWDAEDRLVGVSTPDGSRWAYDYDPLGRRIAKRRLGDDGQVVERTDFVWDGATLAEQIHSGTGHLTTTWDWEPGAFRPVTQTERSQESVDQRFYALVTDLLGTPSEMIDADGELVWRAQTTLWGQSLASHTSGPQCLLRFPGQYHDFETGQNYNFHRYYHPESGRYDSPDPLGLDGGDNPHAYVPNPLSWMDPLGLTPCTREARRQAMRDYGLPNNARMVSQEQYSSGYQYVYEVQTAHGPRYIAVTDQTTDRVDDHGPHWEVGEVKPPDQYGRDPLGRLRVFNQGKTKINYE